MRNHFFGFFATKTVYFDLLRGTFVLLEGTIGHILPNGPNYMLINCFIAQKLTFIARSTKPRRHIKIYGTLSSKFLWATTIFDTLLESPKNVIHVFGALLILGHLIFVHFWFWGIFTFGTLLILGHFWFWGNFDFGELWFWGTFDFGALLILGHSYFWALQYLDMVSKNGDY